MAHIERVLSGIDYHLNTAAYALGISYEEARRRHAARDPEVRLARQVAKLWLFKTLRGVRQLESECQLEAVPVKEKKYRAVRPLDRALLISNGDHTEVLDWIGPDFDWWYEANQFNGDFSDIKAGIWIFEGCIAKGSEPDDTELDGALRALTKEELEQFKDHREGPWDPTLWLEP